MSWRIKMRIKYNNARNGLRVKFSFKKCYQTLNLRLIRIYVF